MKDTFNEQKISLLQNVQIWMGLKTQNPTSVLQQWEVQNCLYLMQTDAFCFFFNIIKPLAPPKWLSLVTLKKIQNISAVLSDLRCSCFFWCDSFAIKDDRMIFHPPKCPHTIRICVCPALQHRLCPSVKVRKPSDRDMSQGWRHEGTAVERSHENVCVWWLVANRPFYGQNSNDYC